MAKAGIVKLVKLLPKWCFLFLVIDWALFIAMTSLDTVICGNISCYRINNGVDLTVNLALVAAIMAILLPVAIELWRTLFSSQNLAPRSPLDHEWTCKYRKRHLNEIVGAVAVFIAMSCVLPLFVKSSALFYSSVFYGIFLLVYAYYTSFYGKPVNIYETEELNPKDNGLPRMELMGELARLTLGGLEQTTEITRSNSAPVWASQLTPELTLRMFGKWSNNAIARNEKSDGLKYFFWKTFGNFLEKCPILVVWEEADSGVLKKLFQTPGFYQSNAAHAERILKTIIKRYIDEQTYYDLIKDLLLLIPVNEIDPKILRRVLSPVFTMLFSASYEGGYTLSDSIPEEWTVTLAHLKDSSNPASEVLALAYLQWVHDAQKSADASADSTAQRVTEDVFSEVETILFSKFVRLRINYQHLFDADAQSFQKSMEKWAIFGGIGRCTVEFTSDQDSEHKAEKRYWQEFKKDSDATLELLKSLRWFPSSNAELEDIKNKFIAVINNTSWSEERKKAWVDFAENQFMLLAADKE